MKTPVKQENETSALYRWKRRKYRVLIVEDIQADAELIELELKRANLSFDSKVVQTPDEFLKALAEFQPDIVLADYRLPRFSALEALDLLHEKKVDIPTILVTGSQTEEIAVDCLKRGADDYILKQSLIRLPSAVAQALVKKETKQTKERAEAELQRNQQELRALASRLQSIREEERARISREIHDELGQTLTALKMDLLWVEGKLHAIKNHNSVETLLQTIDSMTRLIDSLIQTIRRIATELRPRVLDDLGLISAIEWQAHEFRTRTGTECRFTTTVEEVNLDQERSTAVFRILQETLTNVARHAHATKVNIRLEVKQDHLILEVIDNGIGISEAEIRSSRSLGLFGMRERVLAFGGDVTFRGNPGIGTTVTVRIPLGRALASG